eukprot:SAG22_NODE_302_length_12743_cov_12.397738_7_plen_401_part_00
MYRRIGTVCSQLLNEHLLLAHLLSQATELQWKTDLAWEKQMDEERARQRAADRDWAAAAVRKGYALDPPENWAGEWPPKLWHGFRGWTGMRISGEATVLSFKGSDHCLSFLVFLCLSLRFHCFHRGPLQSAWMKGIPRPPSGGDQLTVHRARRSPIPVLLPALGLLSTGRDMGRLMLGLVSGGRYKGKQVLAERLISLFFDDYASPHPFLGGITRGGLSAFRDGPNRAYICEGADVATGSSNSMFLMPEQGVGLFVSFNCCSGHGMHRVHPSLFERFLDHFYPTPPPPPEPAPAADKLHGGPGGGQEEDEFNPPEEKERLLEWKDNSIKAKVDAIFAENQVDLLNTFLLMDTEGEAALALPFAAALLCGCSPLPFLAVPTTVYPHRGPSAAIRDRLPAGG